MQQAQQLGRYHLLDRIAFGGMAEIFRAKTFDSHGQIHLVAVKRVLAHLVEDQDFLQMLVDEAKISALLRHENIARLYEFSRAGDEYFLAMEYVDGKDLRSLLERHRQLGTPIPPEHVAWIAMETAHALHAAHTQRDGAGRALRIVHRDVSPSNVLCSYHGEIKLCDFGIAKATLTRVQTKTGVIKGKVKYMSPEQAMGRKLDHRSDLFSLGTVMYEMLTLQAPFQAPTEIELIFAVRDARKTPIRDVSPKVPDELIKIVDKAMTRSRAARYQSGEDIALDLRIFLDRHTPGYRRSTFSRFMRKTFEHDIEVELRRMEDYEIAQADAGQIGENLIADALGPDAPFTKFTPLYASSTQLTRLGTSNFPAIQMNPPTDLHGAATMMIDRAKVGLGPAEAPAEEPEPEDSRSDFPHLESMLPTIARSDKVQVDDGVEEDSHPADLHSLETRIQLPPTDGAAPTDLPAHDTRVSEPGDLHAQDTRIQAAPTDLHAQATRILMLDQVSKSPSAVPVGGLHDQETGPRLLPGQPEPATVEGYRRLVDGPHPDDSIHPTTPLHRFDAVEQAAPSGPAPEVDTDAVEKIDPEEPELHGLETRIVANPLADGAPTTPFDRSETVDPATLPFDKKEPEKPVDDLPLSMTPPPGPPPKPPATPADAAPAFDDSGQTGEETSVPLKDEDLEPG